MRSPAAAAGHHIPDEPDEDAIEVTVAADGDATTVVREERGVPLDQLAGFGGGIQIHVEDLAAYLAGSGRCDARARWRELQPAYQQLAASIIWPDSRNAWG